MVDEENGHSEFPHIIDLIHGLPDGASSIQPGYEYKESLNMGTDTDKDNEDCSLFVGDIPKTMTEEQMTELFSPFGEVTTVDIKRDRITKASLGYAFIQFKTRSEAANAKKKLHKTVVSNRAIRIGWAQKNTNLFVGDLDPSVTNEMLREKFREFGEIIDDETFAKKQNYGFVKYRRRADAEVAKREMDGKVLGGRRIRTGWGDTNTQRHCVHIQFDPTPPTSSSISSAPVITEEDLFKFFSPFGTVMNVHLPRTASRLRGFGFVRYSDTDEGEESAESAIAALHNTQIAGVSITCNFGKKQHARRPSTSALLPPITPSLHDKNSEMYGNYASTIPQSPKLQMANENTFPISNNNGNDTESSFYDGNKGKDDKIVESTHLHSNVHSHSHSHSKPKGRSRPSYHKQSNHYSPQISRSHNNTNNNNNNNNNNNINKVPPSHASHNNISQIPQMDGSSSHLPSHPSQFPMSSQMMPTMYPTTSWVPTHDGWVPYVVPQYYPSPEDNNNSPVNNMFHPSSRMAEDVSPVYMYTYPNHVPFPPNYSYAYSSHAS